MFFILIVNSALRSLNLQFHCKLYITRIFFLTCRRSISSLTNEKVIRILLFTLAYNNFFFVKSVEKKLWCVLQFISCYSDNAACCNHYLIYHHGDRSFIVCCVFFTEMHCPDFVETHQFSYLTSVVLGRNAYCF